MKRNIAIAAFTAAVLVGGGAAATVAFADDDSSRRTSGTAAEPAGGRDDDGRDDDGRDDDGGKEAPRGAGTTVSLDRAVAAALKAVPGTVTEAELDDADDDDGRTVWELNVYGSDKKWHDVEVDARTAKVVSDREDDDNDDRDRHAPRSASVSLDAAARAALQSVPGSVTSIDLDDDDDDDHRDGVLRWDVEVAGKDGTRHELHVDAKNGKVSVDRDDRNDDRDDDDRSDDDRDDRDDDN
ncbi:PepSY domain-containing protein [Streptomyces clavifer]|uniref:PepSY domain-containing protein n=1 Tax=Streptomyces TaxID=1883 RepID=UPI0029A48207|nr:PepSY domain-containing protein [Streptomyces sp. ND04-05B]MDX3061871.1 PepSY domain-containing protein [Streptomyces sp. ND04-05B]